MLIGWLPNAHWLIWQPAVCICQRIFDDLQLGDDCKKMESPFFSWSCGLVQLVSHFGFVWFPDGWWLCRLHRLFCQYFSNERHQNSELSLLRAEYSLHQFFPAKKEGAGVSFLCLWYSNVQSFILVILPCPGAVARVYRFLLFSQKVILRTVQPRRVITVCVWNEEP